MLKISFYPSQLNSNICLQFLSTCVKGDIKHTFGNNYCVEVKQKVNILEDFFIFYFFKKNYLGLEGRTSVSTFL